jgi:hypothetical protein
LAPEPRRAAGVAGALVILVALGAGISLTEFFVAPGYRSTAVRLISAVVLLVALSRVRGIVRASVERRSAWGADEAGESWADRRMMDPRLARYRDEIRFSTRSQSYFDHLLWPRLVALARGRSPETLAKPPGRRFGLGPSVAVLARLVASLETRR